MEIAKEIEKLRQQKGLSRDKLSMISGITTQTIWRAENGANITIKTYETLINSLKNYNPNVENHDPHIPVSGDDYVVVIN